jgi:hypothetical protein
VSASIVVADADTLFGGTTRGFLIHLSFCRVIELHWSPLILSEMSRALVATNRKPNAQAAAAHESLMCAALPRAQVPTAALQKYFSAVAWAVRSSKDIHVAACAHALVQVKSFPSKETVFLITKNTKDFYTQKLATMGIIVQRPDAFLSKLWLHETQAVAAAFAAFRSTLSSAPSAESLLKKLSADGQSDTAQAMLKLFQKKLVLL